MKFQAKVNVSLKEGVLDPQGQTIGNALLDLGFENILKVKTGKIFTLEIEAETESDATRAASEAASRLLANPVIEQFKVEVVL
ncbi:MAG: phosphoribosylformylglycinamidine synthase subunit PurS [Candidatus Zixiibacteriota bacterium]|nr:MAG: phosphoribosylformylglycinamidine synthase subunit PurS [candidate division Zixibacteria bacterium]